jgi:hypothetical protein
VPEERTLCVFLSWGPITWAYCFVIKRKQTNRSWSEILSPDYGILGSLVVGICKPIP